jgi:hypothetical protein
VETASSLGYDKPGLFRFANRIAVLIAAAFAETRMWHVDDCYLLMRPLPDIAIYLGIDGFVALQQFIEQLYFPFLFLLFLEDMILQELLTV